MDTVNNTNTLGICDVKDCGRRAVVYWPMLERRLCSIHNTPKHAPAVSVLQPDDFDIPTDD